MYDRTLDGSELGPGGRRGIVSSDGAGGALFLTSFSTFFYVFSLIGRFGWWDPLLNDIILFSISFAALYSSYIFLSVNVYSSKSSMSPTMIRSRSRQYE